MNGGKKFDICIQNPPYGSVGGDTLHLRFVDKCLEISNKQVAIFPFTFVTKINHKTSRKFKEKFSPYLTDIEEVDSKLFEGTAMPNVGIYSFSSNESDNISIEYLQKENIKIQSLLDLKEFNQYEEEIVKYLRNQGTQDIISAGGMHKRRKELVNIPTDQHEKFLKNKIIQSCNKLKDKFNNDNVKAGLVINMTNGGMNGKALSSRNGQIFDNYKDFENLFIKLKSSSNYNILLFNSVKAAENCKIALQNPILRFTLYRLQDDQNMHTRVYKYIPAINWEDDRVTTDEGLLEVCGCPKDKCKEYADYCMKIIDEVDKGNRP